MKPNFSVKRYKPKSFLEKEKKKWKQHNMKIFLKKKITHIIDMKAHKIIIIIIINESALLVLKICMILFLFWPFIFINFYFGISCLIDFLFCCLIHFFCLSFKRMKILKHKWSIGKQIKHARRRKIKNLNRK